jgi:hypothetical protein
MLVGILEYLGIGRASSRADIYIPTIGLTTGIGITKQVVIC